MKGRSGPASLSQHKGFPLTQRLDGISIPASESIFSASASSRDRCCVHGQQNEGQPGPLIFQKGEHGNGIVNDALSLRATLWRLRAKGPLGSSCGKLVSVWCQGLAACAEISLDCPHHTLYQVCPDFPGNLWSSSGARLVSPNYRPLGAPGFLFSPSRTLSAKSVDGYSLCGTL